MSKLCKVVLVLSEIAIGLNQVIKICQNINEFCWYKKSRMLEAKYIIKQIWVFHIVCKQLFFWNTSSSTLGAAR